MTDITRRDLLRSLGAVAVAGVASPLGALQSTRIALEPDVEIALTASPADVRVLSGAPTRVWRFTGRVLKGSAQSLQTMPDSYLGPTLRLRRGQTVRIRFAPAVLSRSATSRAEIGSRPRCFLSWRA